MAGRHLFKQMAKYTVTTLLGTAADTVVLWVLSTYLLNGNHVEKYVISPMISFECAVLVNYLTAFFYVWRDRIAHRTKGAFFSHLWKYNLSCASAFILKMVLLNAIALAFKWPAFVCNLIALCFSGFLNFAINEFLIFAKKDKRPQKEEPLTAGPDSLQ